MFFFLCNSSRRLIHLEEKKALEGEEKESVNRKYTDEDMTYGFLSYNHDCTESLQK